ncbi:MAG: hypothetical protein KatS3mg042_0422 [Rhodothermaceae bacterium]|nr:MAG: hypothetical protein KatS3mg042_0422 [Rhodothermaceae bacterium]
METEPIEPLDFVAPLPVPFADSDAAVATAMLHGGEAFLAEHPHALIAATAGDPAFFASLFGIQVPALNHPYWFVTFVGFDVNAEGIVEPAFWVAILDFETGAFAGSFSPVSRTRGLMLQTAAQAYVDDLGLAQDFAWIGLSTPALDPEGYAIPWTYTFHSTSTSTTVKVIYIGPSFVVHEVIENDQELDGTPELPHDVLNTNEALQIALEAGGAAFLETYPNSHIVLDGGYPPSAETGVAQEPVYTIIFNHVPEDASDAAGKVASFASLIVVAHMVTGEVIFRHAEGFDLPVDDAVATLVASEPAHGAVAVPGEATVRFTFDQPVDPYVVADLLEVHPEGALTFRHEAPYLSDDGRSVLFDVTHQPETDYVWVNWGGHRTTDGQVWTVPPFVVQYTTAAEAGAHTVSGSVVYAETAGKTSFRMHGEVAGLRDLLTARAEGLVASSASHPESAVAKAGTLPNDPTHTVVVLLSCDPLTEGHCGEDAARVLGGTVVPDASGQFAIEHVRDGTYWPFAVRFFQPDLPEDVGPAYLGFYDADGDGAPDPVTVSGGSIEGLSLTLYDLFTLLAIPSDEAEGRAWTKAAEYAGDQELLGVLGFPQVDGRALVWYFAFRSASTSTLTVVEVGPFEDASETYPLDPNGPVFAMATLPEGYAASETVMAAAMAEGGAEFMATHEEAFIIATAGRIFQPHDLPVSPEALHRPHWIVLFAGQPIGQPHDDEPDYLIVVLDMEGQVVGRVTREDVASFQQRRERAHQILADLRLDNLMLVGMISPQISADGLSGAWQLAFYAEDRDLLVFVTLLGTDVVDVEVIEQAGLTDVQPLPQNLIDSPQALAAALEAGGQAFLERHPDAKIRFVAGYFLHGDVLGFAPHRVIAIIISDESEEGDPFDLGGADVASAGKASQAERFTAVLDPETGAVLATESTDTAVTVEDDPAMPLPDDFVVEQSYPNPAASRTTIPFELPESASVEIRLFDLQGRQMMTLTRGHFEAGRHEIGLDVSTLPSGAYFYEVRTGNGQRQTRMLMVLH